jgi:hypothetical protein
MASVAAVLQWALQLEWSFFRVIMVYLKELDFPHGIKEGVA